MIPTRRRTDAEALVDVDVHPATELRQRPLLFAALAELFPVRFRPWPGGSPTARPALIAFTGLDEALVAEAERTIFLQGRTLMGHEPRTVKFTQARALDPRLRSRRLLEVQGQLATLAQSSGDDVLASIDALPVWIRRPVSGRAVDVVADAPLELEPGEVLRDRLAPGRFLSLLPLVHFLREVCGERGWQRPQPRSAFVIDDPNLHWSSYGPLSYPRLVDHAREHGYHMSIAMVPFDGWFAHRRTVELFAGSKDVLSLSVHGNDHRLHELGRLDSVDAARPVVAQALRRTAAFERRTGLAVSRVVVPPYEACSEASMQAMLEVGFDAVTLTRPCPWVPLGPPHSPYADASASPLSGWGMSDITSTGFPVLIRRQYDEHDDIVLRAFLGQPIVLYGHVSDLANGLEPLAAAADVVNAVAPAGWGHLADVCSSSFEVRRAGGTLEIRPFARRIRVRVDRASRPSRWLPRRTMLGSLMVRKRSTRDDRMSLRRVGRFSSYRPIANGH